MMPTRRQLQRAKKKNLDAFREADANTRRLSIKTQNDGGYAQSDPSFIRTEYEDRVDAAGTEKDSLGSAPIMRSPETQTQTQLKASRLDIDIAESISNLKTPVQTNLLSFFDKNEFQENSSNDMEGLLNISLDELYKHLQEEYRYITVRISHVLRYDDFKSYFFKEYDQVIISKEIAKEAGEHYHVILSLKLDDGTEKLRSRLKIIFPELKNKSYLMVQLLRSGRGISYVLKDGDFEFKGFTPEQIDVFKKYCYSKFHASNFMEKWNRIKVHPSLSCQEKMEYFVDLKVEYWQLINHSYMVSTMRMLYLREDRKPRIKQYVNGLFAEVIRNFD